MKIKPILTLITDLHIKEQTAEIVANCLEQIDSTAPKNVPLGMMGDIFDVRSAQTLERLSAVKTIMSWASAHNAFAIPGNHDKTDLSSHASYVDLYDKEITVFPDITEFTISEGGELFVISVAPYFEEEYYRALMKEHVDKISKKYKNKSCKHILLTHVSFNGARNNDGSKVTEGIHEDDVKFFDLVLTGHYHDRQSINEYIHYTGSLYQANFGEDNKKGYVVVNTDLSVTYVDLKFPQYKKFKIHCEDKGKIDLTLKMIRKMDEGTNVRVLFTGSFEESQKIDVSEFEKLGVDVKFEETEALSLSDDDNNENLIVYNKSKLIEAYNQYGKQNSLDPSFKTKGIKLLMKNL